MIILPAWWSKRTRRRRGRRDDGSSPVELAVVMSAVFALLTLMLALSVRWLAADAASAAAQRALEVAQAPGGEDAAAQAVAVHLATSSRIVGNVGVTVHRGADQVTVAVTTHPVLGGTVTQSASGPLLRFVPQKAATR